LADRALPPNEDCQSSRSGDLALISAWGSNALVQTHAPAYDKYLRYQMIAGIFRGDHGARAPQASRMRA
jgi:hypothetical protein